MTTIDGFMAVASISILLIILIHFFDCICDYIVGRNNSFTTLNYEQLHNLHVEYITSLNNHGFLEEYYIIKGTPFGFIITKHGFKEQLIDKDYIVRVPDNPTEKDWEVAIIKLNEWVQRKINE